MSMISTVNEAINRKLASVSFTDIIIGTVISLEPLQIRINNRIVIGLSFIEPMSLGIDDNSPSSALPLTVGEKIQMIRYSNGQRFYVLGKSTNASTIDYGQLQNKPKLNTANSTSLAINESEELKGIISLHKVAKTGNFNDLLNKPKLNNIYTFSSGWGVVRYVKIAELTTNIGVKTNNFQAEITGNSDFGYNITGVDFVQASTRGGSKVTVNTINSTSTSNVYGYVVNETTGKTEIWVKLNRWNYEGRMVVTNTVGATVPFTIQTTEPAGIVYATNKVLIDKNYVDTNFLQFEVIEEF